MIRRGGSGKFYLPLTGLESDAIVTVDNHRIQYLNIIASVDVPSVRIGGAMGGIGDGMDIDVVVNNIFAFVDLNQCV